MDGGWREDCVYLCMWGGGEGYPVSLAQKANSTRYVYNVGALASKLHKTLAILVGAAFISRSANLCQLGIMIRTFMTYYETGL